MLKHVVKAAALSIALMAQAHAVNTGATAPDFSLPSLDGASKVNLTDYKGKVVYLDFWASWCGPCRVSFPILDQLSKELKASGFEVVGVNVDEKTQDATNFLKESPVSFTLAADPKASLPETYGVQGMPTSYLIDRQGKVRMVHSGFKKADADHLKAEIVKLLGEK